MPRIGLVGTGDWVKIRQRVVVDAVVVGVAGPLSRPEALLLARPDARGALLPVGLSLPLPPGLRDEAAGQVTPTGEPRRRLPTTVLGQQGAEYTPVHPTLVVEAEATVTTFTARLRPRDRRAVASESADRHTARRCLRAATRAVAIRRPCRTTKPSTAEVGDHDAPALERAGHDDGQL